MHICFLTNEYPKTGHPHGGIGTFVKTIAKQLVLRDNIVSVVGINYENRYEEAQEDGINIYRLKPSNVKGCTWIFNSLKINSKLKEIHSKSPIDIIEAPELGFAFLNKILGIKYVIRLHGGHHFFAEGENRKVNWWKGFQEKLSFSKADHFIGVSEYVVKHTAKYLQFAHKRNIIIYNPANLDRFFKADYSKAERGKIFFAGTICEKKGVKELIQAMRIIVSKVPHAHLFLAGRDWYFSNGQSYRQYVQQFITPDIENSITFLGPIDNSKVPELIEEAEVCVYPSHIESLGLAWIEVLCMGKTLIASNTGPGSEVVKDKETGLLCNPYSSEDIAEKSLRILTDPDYGIKLGKAARKDMLKRFDISTIVDRNIEFFKSIIK